MIIIMKNTIVGTNRSVVQKIAFFLYSESAIEKPPSLKKI